MTSYTAGPDTFDSINYDPKGKPVEEVLGRCDDLFAAIKQKAEAGDRRADKLQKDYDELFQVAKKRTEKDQEEIKQLKEKIKEYSESDKHLNKCIDSIRDQYLELKEENKRLKEVQSA